jgi:hypothetical protein
METNRPGRRLTLRQLLTHVEKCSRDLIEHCQATLLTDISDLRDLSRPVRRRSHYPTMLAVQNSVKKLAEANEEAKVLVDYLQEQLQEIREHARRERVNRP